MLNNELYQVEGLKEITLDDYSMVNGGGVGGVIVYGLNGACIGLVTALVNGLTNDEWTEADTRNCIVAGAVSGACVGLVFPL